MRGVILAGGNGTRLKLCTRVTNKHLLPVFDKPMILYPLETLKSLGCDEILIVSGGNHIGGFVELLGDGREFGVKLSYKVQHRAGGIAHAIYLAKDFSHGETMAIILGDNIFDNEEILNQEGFGAQDAAASIFCKAVQNPQRFGVLCEKDGKFHIEEKPQSPKSNKAVVGLYIYPYEVFEVIPHLKPSARGELEVTDINNYFLNANRYHLHFLSGFWSDAGTPESLLAASNHIYETTKK